MSRYMVATLVAVAVLAVLSLAAMHAQSRASVSSGPDLYRITVTSPSGEMLVDSVSVGLPDSSRTPERGQHLRWYTEDGRAAEFTTTFGDRVEFDPAQQ